MKRVYLIALVVALMAGSATFAFAKQLIDSSKIEGRATQEVLVALVDIPAGATINKEKKDEMFVTKKIVVDFVVPQHVSKIEEIDGCVVRAPILANEQLSKTKFVAQNSGEAGLSYDLKEGEVAYSIAASGVQGVDGYIQEGDSIDIIANEGVLFENLEVLKVATNQEATEAKDGEKTVTRYTSFTLRITPDIAEEIYKMEQDTAGQFKFILHAKIDSPSADMAAEDTDAAE
ncbi:MAG: Flp pilus assembly protein CpaB [Lachnospiraceae bacterium]|nr:Flp pilus assembly protein CpaB [Lachnospiraceae bacterium]